MQLTLKQTEAFDYLEDKTTNELLFGGGAGGAKTVLGCLWQLTRRLQYPGTRGLVGRSKLKTLKETTLNTFWEVCKMQGITSDHYQYNAQMGIIEFNNGSQILLKDLFYYPSDPNFDSLGSLEITDAFIDECNQVSVKAKNMVKSRIRYKLDENGLTPKMLLTCNPAKNWTHSEFYKPSKSGTLPKDKKFIQALLGDNPHISEHYKANLLTLDKNSIERLLHGNWDYDADPDTLMDFDAISDLFSNEGVKAGQKCITADIARMGKDSTVLGAWDGWRLIEYEKYPVTTIPESVNHVRAMATRHGIGMSQTVVDEDGVGGGVKDTLYCQGFVNNSTPLPENGNIPNYKNLKAQCHYYMAMKVNAREVYTGCIQGVDRDTLTEELGAVKGYHTDTDQKIQVMPKEKVKELIGRSPDIADMVMMRAFFDLKNTGQWHDNLK